MAITIELRAVDDTDLDVFFTHQQDADACRMAAFTSKDPADRGAFDSHWVRIRDDADVLIRTVLVDGVVAGHVASFVMFGQRDVTYWIGREYWGAGVATRALSLLLREDSTRPIHARVATDNAASIRVLEKCGFRMTSKERGFANARGAEIDEFIVTLA